MTKSFVRALEEGALAPGARKTVQVGGQCILLCRTAEQALHAISALCSHADKPLERGRLSGTWIGCPAHGARFDLATGRPLNPPATRPITVYELRVVDGWIEVRVDTSPLVSAECTVVPQA